MIVALDWTAWIVIAVTQVLLASKALRSSYRRSWFAKYIYYAVLKTTTLMILSAWFYSHKLYNGIYMIAALPALFLIGMTVREIWLRLYGPSLSLPKGTVAQFISCVVIICSLAPTFTGLFRARRASEYLNAALNVEVAIFMAAVMVFVALYLYSEYLGHTGEKAQRGIIGGFCIALGTNSVGYFLAGQQLVDLPTVQRVGEIAYIGAMLWWYSVLTDESNPADASREEVEAVLRELEEQQV
jgi:hypothetical protein